MRTVGHRQLPDHCTEPSGSGLAAAAQLTQALVPLGTVGLMPKGIYRFATQADANRHADDCLAQAMARLAARRAAVSTADPALA